VSDSAWVTIKGPATNLVSAVTQDSSGNGYLDHIILHFDRPTSFPAGASIMVTDRANGKTYVLPVASVRGFTSSTDSVFVVTLGEPTLDSSYYGIPETGWKPSITIAGLAGVNQITNYPATDGAGPVIWSVVKKETSRSDRTRDIVMVTFSEPIGTEGNAFSISTSPVNVFRVWYASVGAGTETLVEVKGMLDNILSFYQVENDSTVLFYMTNGKDLTTLDYLSLVSDTSVSKLSDKDPPLVNSPVLNNQKLAVTVLGLPPETPQSSNCNCGCGSGTGLAFLPPIGFKVGSWLKRKKEKRAKRE
jgi:hypothetical protein